MLRAALPLLERYVTLLSSDARYLSFLSVGELWFASSYLSPTLYFSILYGPICSYSLLPRELRFLNGPIANTLFFPILSLPSHNHGSWGEKIRWHVLLPSFHYSLRFVFVISAMTFYQAPGMALQTYRLTLSNMQLMPLSNYLSLFPVCFFP